MEEIIVKCFSCLSNQVGNQYDQNNYPTNHCFVSEVQGPVGEKGIIGPQGSKRLQGPMGERGIIGPQGPPIYNYPFSDTPDAYCSNYKGPKIYSIIDINNILLDFYINPFKKRQYITHIKNWSNIMYNKDCTLYVKKGICNKCNIEQYLFNNRCIVCISKI